MTDKIAVFLAEQKRLADDAEADDTSLFAERSGDWSITSSKRTIVALDKLIESAPLMVKALEAVMAMHLPYMPDAEERPNFRVCDSCLDSYEDYVPYPCATVRAITAALEGEETNE